MGRCTKERVSGEGALNLEAYVQFVDDAFKVDYSKQTRGNSSASNSRECNDPNQGCCILHCFMRQRWERICQRHRLRGLVHDDQ
jgi:hypothetical protein